MRACGLSLMQVKNLSYKLDAELAFSEDRSRIVITIENGAGQELSYQDVLDTVVEMLTTHYELVAMPKARGHDSGLH